MNGILTDSERASLLATLIDAPDDILLGAVHELRRQTLAIQEDMKEINGFVGIRPNVPAKLPLAPKAVAEVPVMETPVLTDCEPPGVAPSKIGGETKAAILRCLSIPDTAPEVNKHLRRGASKLKDTEGLLRLLWQRGLVTYDGVAYYKIKS